MGVRVGECEGECVIVMAKEVYAHAAGKDSAEESGSEMGRRVAWGRRAGAVARARGIGGRGAGIGGGAQARKTRA